MPWTPITISDHNVVGLIAGLLNGSSVFTFANGDIPLAHHTEDDGPFYSEFNFCQYNGLNYSLRNMGRLLSRV